MDVSYTKEAPTVFSYPAVLTADIRCFASSSNEKSWQSPEDHLAHSPEIRSGFSSFSHWEIILKAISNAILFEVWTVLWGAHTLECFFCLAYYFMLNPCDKIFIVFAWDIKSWSFSLFCKIRPLVSGALLIWWSSIEDSTGTTVSHSITAAVLSVFNWWSGWVLRSHDKNVNFKLNDYTNEITRVRI